MFEQERQELEKVDVKPSKQRLIILKYLNDTVGQHHTVDEMYSHFREEDANLSLATIYNTINILKEKKLVAYVKMSNGEYRYEKNVESHVHFECKNCRKIYNIASMSDEFEDKNKGFHVEEQHVLFKGVCPDCE